MCFGFDTPETDVHSDLLDISSLRQVEMLSSANPSQRLRFNASYILSSIERPPEYINNLNMDMRKVFYRKKRPGAMRLEMPRWESLKIRHGQNT